MDAFTTNPDDAKAASLAYADALAKSTQIWTNGFQEIAKTMAAMAQAQLDASVSTCKAMAGIKTVPEAIELQTGHVKKSCSSAIADMSALTAATLKLSEEAMAPLKRQIAA